MLLRLGRDKLMHAENSSVRAWRCSGTWEYFRCIIIASVGQRSFYCVKSRSEPVEVVATPSKRRSCRLSTVEGVSLLLGRLHNSFHLF